MKIFTFLFVTQYNCLILLTCCVFYLHTDLRQTMVVIVVDLVEEEEDPHTARREEVGAVLLLGESYC